MTQAAIEGALGYAATSSTLHLRNLRDEGHIERRNRDDAPTYSRSRGYEWRWIGQ